MSVTYELDPLMSPPVASDGAVDIQPTEHLAVGQGRPMCSALSRPDQRSQKSRPGSRPDRLSLR